MPEKNNQEKSKQEKKHQQRCPTTTQNGDRHGQLHPLVIPELLFSLAQFLTKPSLVICVQVSRQWYQTFIPFVWHTVQIIGNKRIEPTPTAIQAHASFVKNLALSDSIRGPDYLSCTFPNLSVLTVVRTFEDEQEIRQTQFLRRHQSVVKDLTIESANLVEALEGFGPQLERLRIDNLFLRSPDQWMNLYESIWSRIRVLYLGEESFQLVNEKSLDLTAFYPQLENATPTKIQDLTIFATNSDWSVIQVQWLLIAKSPELVRLTWDCSEYGDSPDSFQPMTELANALRNGYPQSTVLESLAVPMSTFSSKDLQHVLEHKHQLKELNVNSTNFDLNCWTVLKGLPRYLSTLTHLNLGFCDQMTGAIAQDILCSVTSLIELEVDYMKDTSLLQDPRSWVCLSLKKLTIMLLRTEEDGSLIPFLNQVARLERLEYLDLRGAIACYENADVAPHVRDGLPLYPLELTLETGLNQLRTLGRLKSLSVPDNVSIWSEPEARWVLEHWIKIETILGIGEDSVLTKILGTCYKSY
ncbi:hypothetical protein BGZ83_005905 [Gryganskiella cystojenkinii]|nr:hypothetical protein BGZ83_005905 [Gryganskiella cystojenkinii]